eukprot:CAMPEP_0196582090 /NCGR_PEP_ID=MMETSP1081-20130531/37454_1 /TAXON_ID=36882 /ORGANISM="Pyramimonas amylifera, Strain CCMP720" /LENGTH=64 /DNA_ID=CAMNT_0041902567 /DNA_START=507 /DNA_END=697 /DNA_ORIENTATION=-
MTEASVARSSSSKSWEANSSRETTVGSSSWTCTEGPDGGAGGTGGKGGGRGEAGGVGSGGGKAG